MSRRAGVPPTTKKSPPAAAGRLFSLLHPLSSLLASQPFAAAIGQVVIQQQATIAQRDATIAGLQARLDAAGLRTQEG